MVVFGGNDNDHIFNSGGAYDPIANTWTATSIVGAPSARTSHTAAWTRNEMVIWGGAIQPGGYYALDTGGRYDPITDSWTSTTTMGAPSGRYDHTSIWTGSAMLVWGGRVASSVLDSGGSYVLGASVDNDGDGYSECQGDCNDGNASIYPDAPELCDGVKDDCSAPGPAIPPGELDADHDSFRSCAGDCNDADASIYPGAPQVCDGTNSDCSDPTWPTVPANESDADGDGFRTCQGDCLDTNFTAYPGAQQICDGINNDCSDPSWPAVPANEVDYDGDGYSICAGDCDEAHAAVHPGAAEVCNGIDDNCNGLNDDGITQTRYRDADGDTWGDPTVSQVTCALPVGWVLQAGDCDDTRASVYPGAPEICDGIDNGCNGQVDEDTSGVDSDGDSIHNACDNCRLAYNPDQLDADGDLVGSACDNCVTVANSGQQDLDSDQRGDVCDNCPAAYNPFQDDFDVDRRGDACDNCVFDFNPPQSDFDHDGQGDRCDLNDGLIYVFSTDPNYIEWQSETGPSSWGVYEGDLAVLKSSGIYSQAPGSNPIAHRTCGVSQDYVEDFETPPVGAAKFSLVTGVTGGIEGSLGTNSAGATRPNTNPCP
jgi:hypothetical protein